MSDLGHARSSTLTDAAARAVYRLGYPLARMWWRLRRPKHEGAGVLVYVKQKLLLLRASYRAEWTLPAGGIRRGETPEAAARRELYEEVGLMAGTLTPVGNVRGNWDGRDDLVHFFELRLDQLPELHFDNREIIGARLVSAAELGGLSVIRPLAAYLRNAS